MMTVLGENFKDDLFYNEKTEVCGYVHYKCTLCDFLSNVECNIFQHVKDNHVKINSKKYLVYKRSNPFRASWHRQFPIWAGTSLTDYQLRRACFGVAKDRFNPLAVNVLKMVCESPLRITKLYCPICCFETGPDLEIQRKHYIEKHLNFVKRSISTRMFCVT
jgi:hypothetical protein